MNLDPLAVPSVLNMAASLWAKAGVIPRLVSYQAKYPERWFLYVNDEHSLDLVVLREALAAVNSRGWAPLVYNQLTLVAAFDHDPTQQDIRRAVYARRYGMTFP